MDIRHNKTNNLSPVFKSISSAFNTYIPAMHVNVKDTFVSSTKQQKPTKEQLLSRLKEVDIPPKSKIEIAKNSKENFQIAQAYKLLSDSRLYKNQNVLDSIYGILYSAYEKNSELRSSLIDKYLSTPALYDNELLSSKIGDLISFASDISRACMADKILSTPELYSSEEFTQNIPCLKRALNVPRKESIFAKFLNREALCKNKEMQASIVDYLKAAKNGAQQNYAVEVLDYVEQGIVSPQLAIQLVKYSEFKIEPENFQKLKNAIEPNVYEELSLDRNDIISASRVVPLYNKSSIAEIPKEQRNEVLKGLVKSNSKLFSTTDILKKYFPLIPQSKEEYCSLLPKLAASIGVQTKPLTSEQVEKFSADLNELSLEIVKLSESEFENLEFSQKYPTNEFIQDTMNLIKDLPESEKLKVFDYFGFGLKENLDEPRKFSLVGYPINIDSPEKLAEITDEQTNKTIQNLRNKVVEFSENNSITSNNEKIGELLNRIQTALPELHTMIMRTEDGNSENVLKHSLRLVKKLAQNPQFEKLSESDKKVLLLTAMLHNVRATAETTEQKYEIEDYAEVYLEKFIRNRRGNDFFKEAMSRDSIRRMREMYKFELERNQAQDKIKNKQLKANESAFDAHFISEKFNLTSAEQRKLYTLVKNQYWLEQIDQRFISHSEMMNRCQNAAYDLQHGNMFELAKMFKEATLAAEKTEDYNYRRSLVALAEHSEMIERYIKELQATKPVLPITKLPKASDVNSKITAVNEDGSTNLKGVYKKDGLTIIRFNEVDDWEAIGFPKGSISSGIEKYGYSKDTTGTIKFITHWVYNSDSIANFQEFALPDSEALLSASYLHSPESKALKSGLLLDVATEDIHGGYDSDSYSGCKKTLTDFKKKIFQEHYSGYDREFFAKLIKEKLGYDDEAYRAFVKENANKSMSEIQPEKIRNLLIRAFSSVYTNDTLGDYNEIYVSNAKIQGCYASTEKSGNEDTIAFVDKQKDYLKDYARQNDLLFFVFGD